MSSSYKVEQRATDLDDAVSSAFAEIESLRDEMQETADNMDNGGMGHMDKATRARDAADALDSISQPDIPTVASGLAVTYPESVARRKGRGPSRAVRLANAIAMLEGAKDAAESHIDILRQAADDALSHAEAYDIDADVAREDDDEDSACEAESCAASARSEAEGADSDIESLETLRDDLDNAISEAESVEFPGMFG